MKNVKYYECTICHKHFDKELDLMTCPDCGETGILEIIFDYDYIKTIVSREYFQTNKNYNIWRYLPFLTVSDKYTKDTLNVGWTPLYKSKRLKEILKIKKLYIKDDGQNPTQSLKDRASVIACLKAIEKGKETISCSSTGNAASSLAGNAAKLGLKTVIFVPKRAPVGKLIQLKAFDSDLIKVNGDYKAAFKLSKESIAYYGWYNRNAAINPHLVEGKKTVALEIAEQLGFQPTDWVVVSVGDGCTIAGVYKGFYDLLQVGLIKKIPKILGVQSEGCAPFVEAFRNNEELKEAEENTIADSIAVGIPRNPIKAMNAVKNSKGTFIAVKDSEILSSILLLSKTEGVFAEPAAAASVAGLQKALELKIIKESETATVIVTGNGLKDPQSLLNTITDWLLLEADIDEVKRHIEDTKEKKI
ncbi:MAG: threonine synthase [Tenericutes bacterium]|nr:threonine synthase [Mycoplasmatota bacterium]